MKPVPTLTRLARTVFLAVFLQSIAMLGMAQGSQVIPTGSFIINMGVTPQTYANGLKPYGLLYDLLKNRNVTVLWAINSTKLKDAADFTYNGVQYRGGTFIVTAPFRTAAVNSTIATWVAKGVQGITTTSDFTAEISSVLRVAPRWTLDRDNGKIAQGFMANAEIEPAAYGGTSESGWKLPSALGTCDDIFVMPHADPTWSTHSNLYYWNKTFKGAIWAGCHAVSVLESISGTDSRVNPSSPGTVYKANFLTTTGLINFKNHADGSPPYTTVFPTDPIMQFMGIADAAMQNGSEQIFLPLQGGAWLPSTTRVSMFDPSQADVPSKSPGQAALIAYGRAFGDNSRGLVMYEAAHDIDKLGNDPASVAAQRAFMNFSFLAANDKAVIPSIAGMTGSSTITSGSTLSLMAALPVGTLSSNYTFAWSSSCGGSFSPNAATQNVTFTAPIVASGSLNCLLTVVIRDACGREFFNTLPVTITAPLPKQPISGFVFNDANGDGSKGGAEAGTGLPLFVKLVPKSGTTCGTTAVSAVAANTTTGAYSFSAVDVGAYCLVVDNNSTLTDVTPTLPAGYSATTATIRASVTVASSPLTNQNFGLRASPPVAGDDAVSTAQNTPVTASVTTNDSDPDNNINPNGFTKLTNPTNGTVVFNANGSYTYTPNTNYLGPDSFTYQVCDLTQPTPLCDVATVNINVTAGVTQPVSGFVFNDLNGDGSKGGSEAGTGLPLFVKLVPKSGASCGTTAVAAVAANTSTGAYNFAGVSPGSYCLVLDNNTTLTDVVPSVPTGYSATTPTTISSITVVSSPITNRNFGLKASPPVAGNDVATTPQNTPVTASVTANDSDPDGNINPNGFTKLTDPTNGTVVFNANGSYTYTPNTNYLGPDSFTYQVCDLTLPTPLCDVATVNINVTAGPAQAVSGFVFNDINGDGSKGGTEAGTGLPLFVKLVPRSGTICGTTAVLAVAANTSTGAYSFPTVNPGNYCLVLDDNSTLTDVAPTIPPGYGATTSPTISAVVVVNTPVADQNFGLQARPPVALNDVATTPQNTPVTASVNVNDSDLDGNINPNGFTKLTNPTNGTVVFNANGSYTYTPNTNYLGPDSFTYQVCDLTLPAPLCATATVNINVIAGTPQPVSGFVFNDLNGDGSKGGSEAGTGLPLFVKLVPKSGASCGTTAVSAVAANTSTGAYSFAGVSPGNYCLVLDDNSTLTDVTQSVPEGYANTTSPTISAVVVVSTPVADQNFGLQARPPVAGNDVATTPQNTPVTASVTANDDDPDDNLNPTGYTRLTNPTNGTVVFNPNGSYTYTPNTNYLGPDSFTYQVCDLTLPAPLCATATVNINVTTGPAQPVSGFVFNDANSDGVKGIGESGTETALFVKLVPRSGAICGTTAVAVAVANVTTGAYSFPTVNPGNYCLVLDDNSILTDVTPTVPATLINTTPTTISSLSVVSSAITDQNFGLKSSCLARAGTLSK
jgi:hypothetical protein